MYNSLTLNSDLINIDTSLLISLNFLSTLLERKPRIHFFNLKNKRRSQQVNIFIKAAIF